MIYQIGWTNQNGQYTMNKNIGGKAEQKLIEKLGRATAQLKYSQKMTNTREKQCRNNMNSLIEMVEAQDLETEEKRARARRIYRKDFVEVLEEVLEVIGLQQEEEDVIAQFRTAICERENHLQQTRSQMEGMINDKQKKYRRSVKHRKDKFVEDLSDNTILYQKPVEEIEDQQRSVIASTGRKIVKTEQQSNKQTALNYHQSAQNSQASS